MGNRPFLSKTFMESSKRSKAKTCQELVNKKPAGRGLTSNAPFEGLCPGAARIPGKEAGLAETT
jgi:hypothetical protein